MDEEDGRPGARAVHSGPIDARRGVSAPSLRTRRHDPAQDDNQPQILRLRSPKATSAQDDNSISDARLPFCDRSRSPHPIALIQKEENHENLPGK